MADVHRFEQIFPTPLLPIMNIESLTYELTGATVGSSDEQELIMPVMLHLK